MKGKTKIVKYPWDDKYIPDYDDFISLRDYKGIDPIIIRRNENISGGKHDDSNSGDWTWSTRNNPDD